MEGRRPLPWIDNMLPKSVKQPGVRVQRKTFVNHDGSQHDPSYPWRLYSSINRHQGGRRHEPDKILYYEMRGRGPPPIDIGFPGDIYLSTEPAAYSLWAKGTDEWMQWPGPRPDNLLKHPHLSDRWLWCSKRGVGWKSKVEITVEVKTTSVSVDVPAETAVSEFMQTEASSDIVEEDRTVEEMLRRRAMSAASWTPNTSPGASQITMVDAQSRSGSGNTSSTVSVIDQLDDESATTAQHSISSSLPNSRISMPPPRPQRGANRSRAPPAPTPASPPPSAPALQTTFTHRTRPIERDFAASSSSPPQVKPVERKPVPQMAEVRPQEPVAATPAPHPESLRPSHPSSAGGSSNQRPRAASTNSFIQNGPNPRSSTSTTTLEPDGNSELERLRADNIRLARENQNLQRQSPVLARDPAAAEELEKLREQNAQLSAENSQLRHDLDSVSADEGKGASEDDRNETAEREARERKVKESVDHQVESSRIAREKAEVRLKEAQRLLAKTQRRADELHAIEANIGKERQKLAEAEARVQEFQSRIEEERARVASLEHRLRQTEEAMEEERRARLDAEQLLVESHQNVANELQNTLARLLPGYRPAVPPGLSV